jgi:hypothetical protein
VAYNCRFIDPTVIIVTTLLGQSIIWQGTYGYHFQVGSSTDSDMVSVTAGFGRNTVVALMTPLPNSAHPATIVECHCRSNTTPDNYYYNTPEFNSHCHHISHKIE